MGPGPKSHVAFREDRTIYLSGFGTNPLIIHRARLPRSQCGALNECLKLLRHVLSNHKRLHVWRRNLSKHKQFSRLNGYWRETIKCIVQHQYSKSQTEFLSEILPFFFCSVGYLPGITSAQGYAPDHKEMPGFFSYFFIKGIIWFVISTTGEKEWETREAGEETE